MDQSYFVVDAPAGNGRISRIHISHKALAYFLSIFLVIFIVTAALFSSYVRMSWKVSKYDQLRAQF